MPSLLSLALVLLPPASAGPVELGASANYRATNYDKENFIQSSSYTASISYYVRELCAVEFNYTNGYAKQVAKGPLVTDPRTKLEDQSIFTSVDLVFSLAERDEVLRPYVKVGGGYLLKDRYRRIDYEAKEKLSRQEGLVPSAGLGIAIGLTPYLNLKFGADAWTSPFNTKPRVFDYVGRAGIAWIL